MICNTNMYFLNSNIKIRKLNEKRLNQVDGHKYYRKIIGDNRKIDKEINEKMVKSGNIKNNYWLIKIFLGK